jgi:hypothetical protein
MYNPYAIGIRVFCFVIGKTIEIRWLKKGENYAVRRDYNFQSDY